jgi:hypothetical protein
VDVRVYGAEDIARVAAEVRRFGNGREIPNKMAKRIRRAVPPIRRAVKASAVATLPSGGGLGSWVARAGVRASVRRGGRSAGIALVSGRRSQGGRSDLRRINEGRTRHPLWGNRRHWYPQTVTPGYFDRAVEGDGLDAFRREVNDAIGDAVREVFGG